jgi:hypothetical protein
VKALLLAILSLLFIGSAEAASSANVQQSGLVTPSHAVSWGTTGVIQDAGTSQFPGISTIGILSQNLCPFAISTALAPNPYTQLCFGVVPGQYAEIGLNSYGGAAPLPLLFNINGTIYTFPFLATGVIGPSSSIVGDVACWNNTTGSLLYDCGKLPTGGSGGNVVGPTTSVINDFACWNNVSGTVLKDCGTGGTGNVVGPASSIINDVACWNNATGTLLKDCGAIVAGSGTVNPATAGQLAWYASSGTVVSGLGGAGSYSILQSTTTGSPSWVNSIYFPQNPSLPTSPTGNPTGGALLNTYSTVTVQGVTQNAGNREFLVNLGLVSNTGAGVANNNMDKVALYVGAVGTAGTGDLWAFNPLLSQNIGSGTYNAQVIEVDENNYNTDKGGLDGPTGYPTTVANGISISGASDSNGFTNTTGLAINSFGGPSFNLPLWAHGQGFFGTFKYNEILDLGQAPTAVALFGGHAYGVDCSLGNFTAGCLKLSNGLNGGIIGQNGSFPTNSKLLRFDGTNEFIAEFGVAGVFFNAALTPSLADTYSMGGPTTRWNTIYADAFDASQHIFVNGISVVVGTGVGGQCAQWTNASTLAATGAACGSGGGGGGVSSVTSVDANTTITPTTGAVTVQLNPSPVLTSVGVGTSSITSTISDGGTLGVAGAAAFNSAVSIAGSLQLTGIGAGSPVGLLCYDGTNQVRQCSGSATGNVLASGTATNGQCFISNGTSSTYGATIGPCGTGSGTAVPGGRLTIQSTAPVQFGTDAAVTTMYYDSYISNAVPVWNGSAYVALPVGSDEIALTLSTTNHVTNNMYDVFGVSSSGTLVLCTGPAWTATNFIGTSSRAQAVAVFNGVKTNSATMTNCFNGATNYGSVAAHQGTYLGTIYIPAGAGTLSAAITTTGQSSISVTSACGTGSRLCFPQKGATSFYILIDSEIMQVSSNGGQGTTSWTVSRAALGTTAATHSNGAAIAMANGQVICNIDDQPAAGATGAPSNGGEAPQCDYYNAYNKVTRAMTSVDGKASITIGSNAPLDGQSNNLIFIDGGSDVWFSIYASLGMGTSAANYGLYVDSDVSPGGGSKASAFGIGSSSSIPTTMEFTKSFPPKLGSNFAAMQVYSNTGTAVGCQTIAGTPYCPTYSILNFSF